MTTKRTWIVAAVLCAAVVAASVIGYTPRIREKPTVEVEAEVIELPEPVRRGVMSVEEAIQRRRSIRSYKDEPITISHLSQLLWAAQGITDEKRGFRAAPSAGALYPLELYVVVGERGVAVDDGHLKAGVYHYSPRDHSIRYVLEGDLRRELATAALGQMFVADAPVILVITAIYERTTIKYGKRGIRYVHLEAGHAAQNVYLQAVALELGTVVVGAFYDERVKELLKLDEENPLYLMPIGHPR